MFVKCLAKLTLDRSTDGEEYACALSHVSLYVTTWMVAHQAPLSMGFSRQEYWSGLLFPTLGDLPNPGINLCLSCFLYWQADSSPLCHLGSLGKQRRWKITLVTGCMWWLEFVDVLFALILSLKLEAKLLSEIECRGETVGDMKR